MCSSLTSWVKGNSCGIYNLTSFKVFITPAEMQSFHLAWCRSLNLFCKICQILLYINYGISLHNTVDLFFREWPSLSASDGMWYKLFCSSYAQTAFTADMTCGTFAGIMKSSITFSWVVFLATWSSLPSSHHFCLMLSCLLGSNPILLNKCSPNCKVHLSFFTVNEISPYVMWQRIFFKPVLK